MNRRLLPRTLLTLALLAMAWPAAAQTAIGGWKSCNTKYGSCTRKCPPPIYVTIEGGKTKAKPNSKHFSCLSKCSDSLHACMATDSASNVPACTANSQCPPQADGSPVICSNGRCLAT